MCVSERGADVLWFQLSEGPVALSSRHSEKAPPANTVESSVRILPMEKFRLRGIDRGLRASDDCSVRWRVGKERTARRDFKRKPSPPPATMPGSCRRGRQEESKPCAAEESLRKLPKGDEPENGRSRQKIQFPAPSLSRKTGAEPAEP